MYEKFSDIYKKAKVPNKNKKQRKINPWINNKLLEYCNIRDKLYNRWLNNKTNKNYEKDYKRFRNMLNKKLIYARNNHYKT